MRVAIFKCDASRLPNGLETFGKHKKIKIANPWTSHSVEHKSATVWRERRCTVAKRASWRGSQPGFRACFERKQERERQVRWGTRCN